MSKYTEIEQERVSNKKYIIYTYNRIHEKMPDGFNPTYNWCKYWVDGINGGPSRINIFDENMKNHNYEDCDNTKPNFKTVIEPALKKQLINPKMKSKDIEQAEAIINYFKTLTTTDKNNPTCYLMVYAGATINWETLLIDIEKTKNPKDYTKILQTLTSQVNAAALNGAFSRMYHNANKIGVNSPTPNNADKTVENIITNLYTKTMFGENRIQPVDIPSNPAQPFKLLIDISSTINNVQEKSNLTQEQVIKELINPCEFAINTSLQNSKIKKFKV